MVSRDRDRNRRIDARQLLDRDRIRQRVGAGATVLLRNRHSHQSELRELGHKLVRKLRFAVEFLRNGRDTLRRELAHGRPDELVLGAELEVQVESAVASSTIMRTP